jgi:hypothetical protein
VVNQGKKGKANSRQPRQQTEPLRWDEIPHSELWEQAHAAMSCGPPERAREDSLRSVLRRRLSRMDATDHARYIELECAHLVETLRFLRDTYRAFLEPRTSGPLVEMYWVILRYGVKDWAVMVLRTAAIRYVSECRLNSADWDSLFGFEAPLNDFFSSASSKQSQQPERLSDERLLETVRGLLRPEVFDEILVGGPFGRDAQVRFARRFPGRAALLGQETFAEALEGRLRAWDASSPWTEGLSRLFDAAQEELFFQQDALGDEGRLAESAYSKLSTFEKIVHRRLVYLSGRQLPGTPTKHQWELLLPELDKSGISPEDALQGAARETLMTLRRKGVTVRTWTDCYGSTKRVTLEDGEPRTLRREMTRALHNAAAKAEYQLSKIWGNSTAVGSSSKAAQVPKG